MKHQASQQRRCLAAAAFAVILSGCAGFSPAKDAANTAYQPPRGSRGPAFENMVNARQARHLEQTTFPRLSETERALMIEINRDVNEDITYLSDDDNYGWADFAVIEPRFRHPVARGMPTARYGDCEDYALTKKHRLTERGMDPSRLFVVGARVSTAEGEQRHVVVAVPEGSEWWILNNWDNRIEPASYLQSWWEWKFEWPSFDHYRQLARARNGSTYGAGRPRG